jgi:cytochrome b involved in lipid metabolism
MGWFSLHPRVPAQAQTQAHVLPSKAEVVVNAGSKTEAEHVEHVEIALPTTTKPTEIPPRHVEDDVLKHYPFQDPSIPDENLPFINTEEVLSRKPSPLAKNQSSRCWIVVDDIVHDCTEFLSEHPGGETVIESFNGEDCSWQFWRFHSKAIMEQYGRELRVGRTAGVKNRFKEPPRYVGLSRLGNNDDW